MSARIFSTMALSIIVSVAAFAADDVRGDAGITRSQADAILDELKQIRHLLEGQAKPTPIAIAPPKRAVKVEGGYTLGSETAPLTMVEYTDYQCPFCRSFEGSTFDEIRKQYIDTGKLRFVSRNLPLEIHHDAMNSAEAALCAGDQGQYWPMRELLFKSPSLANDRIVDFAQNLKIDVPLFRSCLEGEKHKAEILNDVRDAQALQITGTPAFVIGKTTGFGVEGYVTAGALPFAQFDAKLKASQLP